ncbi:MULTISPECIES: hypothetical protein [unclassified Kitasatospora]|uniref:hypothetical protein n=1 Tax=unclassified Kitasatospora TaxID=2633591 RepID=UPI0007103122|nr:MULTISPECIES: hypothetical protein [unclassified Kitasatospora]KQV20947.1 hypothetical protein ASC99_20815 [Kitasatospora sp. Root107]KRB60399.1 hypothetical protein ASE03_12365 [Kitasatospora sp. Root187]
MTAPRNPGAVLGFGWEFDLGEFVVAPRRLDPAVKEVLDEAGFWYRAEPLGAWHMHQAVPVFEQADAAAAAVRLLAAAGEPVRNWHTPQQRLADVVRHYAWLTSEGPFPDAAATARAARAEADLRLSRPQSPDSRTVTEMIARGELLVEARRTFGDNEWMIASERDRPDNYLELQHHLPRNQLYVTGEPPASFAGHVRRSFRQHILRETRHPVSVRARAATAASRAFTPGTSREHTAAPPPAAAPGLRR